MCYYIKYRGINKKQNELMKHFWEQAIGTISGMVIGGIVQYRIENFILAMFSALVGGVCAYFGTVLAKHLHLKFIKIKE